MDTEERFDMGVQQEAVETEDDESWALARPWPRFWARMFDLLIYALPLGFLLGLVFPQLFYMDLFAGQFGELILGMLILPLVMLLDAAVLSIFQTSPGKAIAGLRVVRADGQAMDMEKSINRNLRCYVQGLALGVPLVNLATYIAGYNRVEESGTAAWDDATDTRVWGRTDSGVRTVIVAVLVILINLGYRML